MPSSDTQHVYVSASEGLDTNDGRSAAQPKRSLAAALRLLRDGAPDWLHVRRGDVFVDAFGEWTLSGRPDKPLVVTTYGDDDRRPLFLCKFHSGLTLHSAPVHDVAFVGLHLLADSYDGQNGEPFGISVLAPAERLLFEDCRVERFFTNIRLQGPHRDVAVRRCVIVDAFTAADNHAQGIYVDGVDGCRIEECLFDHNGWRPEIAGAVPTIFRHNIYVQGNTSAVAIVGNVIARAGSHGLQARSGGEVRDNLFVGNPIHMLVGNNVFNNGAVTATVVGNVMLDGRDIDARERRGWAAHFQCLASGEVAYNLAAHQDGGTAPRSYQFDSTLGVGIHNVDFHHNVAYRWGAPMVLIGTRFSRFLLRHNDLQEQDASQLLYADVPKVAGTIVSTGNRMHSGAPAAMWVYYGGRFMTLEQWRVVVTDTDSAAVHVRYPRPELTLAAYDLVTGGPGSVDGFLERARTQSQARWRDQLTGTNAAAAFRAGFGLVVPR